MLIFVPLCVLLILNGQATRVLMQHGIRVGFFGASRSDMALPVQQFRKSLLSRRAVSDEEFSDECIRQDSDVPPRVRMIFAGQWQLPPQQIQPDDDFQDVWP